MNFFKRILVVTLLLPAVLPSLAEEREFKVQFQLAKSQILWDYANNAAQLRSLMSCIDSIGRTGARADVTIASSASPEGPELLNEGLCRDRKAALIEWLSGNVPADYMNLKDGGIRLNQADLGQVKLYPSLRYARAIVNIPPKPEEPAVAEEPAAEEPVETVEEVVATVETEPETREPGKYVALKTNMLYDAALVPNLGIEVPINEHWSLGANGFAAWWNKNKTHRYWRMYGAEVYGRYWLDNSHRLTGHHFGVFGQALIYDFEFGGTGYLGGTPSYNIFHHPSYAFGGEYGYSLRIAKRFNIDFSIEAGYLGGRYYVYKPIDNCYVWQQTKQRHWFGPIKLEVSLEWLIGRVNETKKGGAK